KVWEKHKAKLVNHCPLSQKADEKICCFDKADEQCHIPWLALNRGLAHPVIRNWNRDITPMTSYCFSGDDSFLPLEMEQVLKNKNNLSDGIKFWKLRNVGNPLGRIAYHFQQANMRLQQFNCNSLFDNTTVVGAIWIRAFTTGAGRNLVPESEASDRFFKQIPQLKPVSHHYKDTLPCLRHGPPQLPSLPANYRGKEVCNIFTLWDYNLKHGGPPVFNKLNVESWRRRTHNLCKEPILINDDNVKEWIPDMPDEYFRMPAKAAKSDLIRYALLYHHGGLYMDADFIAIQDFEPIVGLLGDYELVSYSDKAPEGQQCDHGFSSNLLGGKKGSRIHKAIWEAQK
ncbi:unnamed protein product, partial [Polarella glacialis]